MNTVHDEEYRAKVEEYKNYVQDHIRKVQKVWKTFLDVPDVEKVPELQEIKNSSHMQNLYGHDYSKTFDLEFYPYRRKFYPTEQEKSETDAKEAEEDFLTAFRHHVFYNFHHWNHWVLVTSPDKIIPICMPLVYSIEMLADWGAMSLAKGNEVPSQYYEKIKDSIVLHPKTREEVEKFIGHFDQAVTKIRKIEGETI